MKKIEISQHLLIKNSNLPLVEKLLLMANYFDELELAKHIKNYINMEKTYKEMGDQLLQAGFKIPSSKDVVSFFKNKILEIYYNDYNPCEGFITWLNN
jgi:hypothetical protein